MLLIPTLGRQRQADLCESEANLVYLLDSWTAKVIQCNPASKEKIKQTIQSAIEYRKFQIKNPMFCWLSYRASQVFLIKLQICFSGAISSLGHIFLEHHIPINCLEDKRASLCQEQLAKDICASPAWYCSILGRQLNCLVSMPYFIMLQLHSSSDQPC